jgi:hypothetical protein
MTVKQMKTSSINYARPGSALVRALQQWSLVPKMKQPSETHSASSVMLNECLNVVCWKVSHIHGWWRHQTVLQLLPLLGMNSLLHQLISQPE